MKEKIEQIEKLIADLEAERDQRLKDEVPSSYVHVAACNLRGALENLNNCVRSDAERAQALNPQPST